MEEQSPRSLTWGFVLPDPHGARVPVITKIGRVSAMAEVVQ